MDGRTRTYMKTVPVWYVHSFTVTLPDTFTQSILDDIKKSHTYPGGFVLVITAKHA